jgi:1-aminocyclopropane-1-carboxylate deaminase
LQTFIDNFSYRHGLVLDWVYVAKMMYGIQVLAERDRFAPGTRVVAVITG